MSDLVEIILQAVDNASGVFDSVSNSVNSMADQISNATGLASDDFTTMENNVTGFQDAVSSIDSTTITDLSTELGMSTEEVERLIDAGSQIGGIPFNDAAAAAGELETSVNGADDAVQTLGNDLDIINSSMILQLGEQIGALGTQAEGMSQDMNTAAITVGQLATQTGIAESEMVGLINNISNATFPNEEAMMYVKSLDQMGVSAENLGESATNIDRINDAFGLGAQTTNSLAQELGVLGVDMNNVNSSFNALAYANANTVGGMQNYYSFLRKYDAQFKELGFDVDQSSIIIAAATQKYGGGRAALSGLSEALETADGDTRKLEEALGIQAGTLDNASAVTGEYEGQLQALADEEAEHKTFLDQLGAAWEDASLSLSGILSPLTSFAGLIGGMGSFALQINGLKALADTVRGYNIVASLTNAIEGEGAIARVASAIGITTEAAAADTAAVSFGGLAIAEGAALWPILAIIAAIGLLVLAVYEIGKAFGWWSDVSTMLDAVQAGVQRLWNAFINHPDVQGVINGIRWAWQQLQPAIQAVISWVGSFFNSTNGSKFDVVRALIDMISMRWRLMTTPIRLVIQVIRLLVNAIQNWYTRTRANIEMVKALFRALPGAIRGLISGLVNILTSPFSNAYSSISGIVGKIKSVVGGITGINISAVTSKLTKPFTDAYDNIVGIVEKIKSKANSIPVIGGAFGGLDLLDTPSSQPASVDDTLTVNVNNNLDLTLDLRNVPSGIDEALLHELVVDTLTDKQVLGLMVNNPDFQELDGRAKSRILARSNRARGV